MALQSSGLITLAQIQAEFGGSNPISLSEYYRNGTYVTSNNTSVPTSGAISVSNFYGALKRVTSSSIVAVTNTSGDYTTVTLPTGLQVGDILVVSRSSNSGSSSIPTGWTLIKFNFNGNGAFYDWGSLLAYKVVTSTSESGTNVGTFGNGYSNTGATVWAIRPNIPASQIIVKEAYGWASINGGPAVTINAADSSFCTITLVSSGGLSFASSTTSLINTTTNEGTFRNAAGGTDPIPGSQNYLTGQYQANDDNHRGNQAYAFCQSPESAVDIYASFSDVSLVSAYLEVR